MNEFVNTEEVEELPVFADERSDYRANIKAIVARYVGKRTLQQAQYPFQPDLV